MEPTLRRATTEMSPLFLCPAAAVTPPGEGAGGVGLGTGGGYRNASQFKKMALENKRYSLTVPAGV